ncbi:MAG: hypothetical protein Ct9H90mP1_3130 [Methanobacteriota archaeon]|nr:MAG: hypothetical protein Ct9H90mP1_3130 [Euryarchaeota archaeon]
MATLLSKHTPVICSFITPYESVREKILDILPENSVMVHVSTTLEVCEQRDVKGLYAKARSGGYPISLVFRIHSMNPSAPTSHSILAGKTVTRWMIWWTSFPTSSRKIRSCCSQGAGNHCM